MKKTEDSVINNEKTVEVNILGTSDIHGRFMPWEYATDSEQTVGSLTQISTFISDYKKSNDNVIIVDCGDTVQDNYVETLINDETNPMMVGMNEIGYDIWVLGNHEFNFNKVQRQRLIDEFNGTTLCGNVYNEDGSRYLKLTQIIEKDGVKIGLIGITTPMIVQFEKGKDSLHKLNVNDAVLETRKAINELQGKVDAIIGIMHMGEENENNVPGTGVIDIANECSELDAVIAGHMHLDVNSNIINGVLITEPYKYGQRISEVNLVFAKDESTYKLISKKAQTHEIKNIQSDKALEIKLKQYHEKLRSKVNESIGVLMGEDLCQEDEIKGISSVYTEPTAITNLFLDVAKFYSKADVIALCTDNENAQMKAGCICIKDISRNYTYTGGEITVYKICGSDLKAYMEWSADYFNKLNDGDLTISYNPMRRNSKYSTDDIFGNVKYEIDLREESGNRIKNLTFINGDPINNNTKLTLGMNSYRMEKLQESNGIFAGKEFEVVFDTIEKYGEHEGTIRNLTIKYIKEELNGILKGNFTRNWSVIGIDKTSYEYKLAKKLINDGMINLPTSEEGKWTNVKSITKDDLKKYINTN